MENNARTTVTPLRRPEDESPAFRKPPANVEAEQALLGAVLVNNRAFEQVSEFLRPEHFADPVHGRIFDAVGKQINRGQAANPTTLQFYFERDEQLAERGGHAYLARLAASAITVINARDYGRTIHDLFLRRQLIALGEDTVNEAYASDIEDSATDQIERTEQRLYDLATVGDYQNGFRDFPGVLTETVRMVEAAFKRDGKLVGLSTGLTDLDALLGGLHNSDLLVLAGRPSMGKAQPLDARIRATSGWTTMGVLKLGDELASVDGRRSIVSGIYPQGEKQIYRVRFSDGRTTECCAEHLWRVHFRSWPEPRVLSTGEIANMLQKQRYRDRLWIDHCSGHFGGEQELPIDPWLLGALLGDGNLKGGSIRFSTASHDMLTRVQKAAGSDIEVAHLDRYDYRLVQAAGHRRPGRRGVWPNPLKEALTALGLWDTGSEAKFVPESYKIACREARLSLLKGLLDTDGWIERWGSVRFATTSPRLADDVVEIARSLGAWCMKAPRAPRYTYKGEVRAGRPAYVCNIHYPNPCELFSIPEKKARTVRPRRRKFPVFKSIEPTRISEARCIAVTHPEHLYVTDDYVVTHNTALATNIAFHVAKHFREEADEFGNRAVVDGAAVGFFSLEMSAEQLAARILSEEAGISSDKMRKGQISDRDFDQLAHTMRDLQSARIFIDDTPALTISALRTRARRLKRQHGLGLIVIDYLQLLSSAGPRSDNRVQEVSEITRGLKTLAKELDVPVLALSQLSRQVEQRDDKRPQLSDLRESGSIEQDADVVMFIFREEYYHSRREPREGTPEHASWQAEGEKFHNIAEVIIAKQRHGPTGRAMLHFNAMLTKFGNLAKDDYLPDEPYG